MKYIKTKLEWKEYKAYPDKVVFKSKCGSNGTIHISKTLNQFASLDFLYLKNKKFKIKKETDRGKTRYRAHIKQYSNKSYTVYLRTNKEFKNILIKALNSKKDIFKKYTNPNFRLHINKDGRLLLRFLINLSSKTKAYAIAHLLNKQNKTITLKKYKKIINKLNINNKFISPFIKNYYTHEITKDKPLKIKKLLKPELFRLIGLINGDGTLTKYGAYFYNNNKILHKDFIKISKDFNKAIKIKRRDIKTTFKTYWYSKKLADKLNQNGAIYNRKLDFLYPFKINNNLLAYSEYLSGIYDTEGAIIKDSNVVIPTGVTICNKNIQILDKKELNYLYKLAKKQGIYTHFRNSGSEYYRLGLNKLKQNKQGLSIFKKLRNHYPGLALSHKLMLDNINVNSKLDLKHININLKTNTVTALWWVKIGLIKDVIKFTAIIKPHIKQKSQKLNNFILNHVAQEDLKEIKNHIFQNGTQNMGTLS